MRNPVNWNVYALSSQPAMLHGERGYTGHEQLNQFGLINMNARMYDPLLARFLAPDPFVSSGMTNDFNRYVYCRNNPMMYTDPSGKSWNFEIGWGSGSGFFYRGSNGDSGFYGNYNPNSSTFTAGSTYYGYQSTQIFSQQTYSNTSFFYASQSYNNYANIGINSGTLENENGDLAFNLHYQLHEVVVTAKKSYKNSIGYPIFGELLSGKGDDRGYGPWNPDIRLPDYYSLNISATIPNPLSGTLLGLNSNISIDRYRQIYVSPWGASVAKSMILNYSLSLTANWLSQSNTPTATETYNFLSGHGVSVGGGYIGGLNWSISPFNNETKNAFGIGLYTPQIGGSYNYTPDYLIFNK